MKRGSLAGLLVIALGAGSLQAADEVVLSNLGTDQNAFKRLSEDLASATSYKGLTPAEPLGITGFDIGIEVTDTSLQYASTFNKACNSCGLDRLTIPKLHLHKGLPMGFDVGLMYASTSNTNVTLTGVELRYANIEGGMAKPAVATRLTWSQLDGVDQLSLESMGVEVMVSKGIAMFTPYGGIGQNWVSSEATGFTTEEFTQSKYFVGVNINTGFINFDFEMDDTGGAKTIGAKVGFRF
ncbi:MAG: hypothetical protein ABFS08_06400 [Pseudomonadota bacterium]